MAFQLLVADSVTNAAVFKTTTYSGSAFFENSTNLMFSNQYQAMYTISNIEKTYLWQSISPMSGSIQNVNALFRLAPLTISLPTLR